MSVKSKAGTTTATMSVKSKATTKKANPPTKYLILELEECGNCVSIRRGRGGARSSYNPTLPPIRQFAKVDLDKVTQFKIDISSVHMECPACNMSARFIKIKWWGTGFEDGSSIYSDAKEKKEVEVSDVKDITKSLLKHKAVDIKKEIKCAESKLDNLVKLNSSLKSIMEK